MNQKSLQWFAFSVYCIQLCRDIKHSTSKQYCSAYCKIEFIWFSLTLIHYTLLSTPLSSINSKSTGKYSKRSSILIIIIRYTYYPYYKQPEDFIIIFFVLQVSEKFSISFKISSVSYCKTSRTSSFDSFKNILVSILFDEMLKVFWTFICIHEGDLWHVSCSIISLGCTSSGQNMCCNSHG